MTEARGDTDHRVARLDQREERRQRRPRQSIGDDDVVPFRRAAEMTERQRPEPIAPQRRRQLVVGELQIFRLHRQRVLEPGEDEDVLGAVLSDQRVRALELPVVVGRRREDRPARVRQRGREGIAEAIGAHVAAPFPTHTARTRRETPLEELAYHPERGDSRAHALDHDDSRHGAFRRA